MANGPAPVMAVTINQTYNPMNVPNESSGRVNTANAARPPWTFWPVRTIKTALINHQIQPK